MSSIQEKFYTIEPDMEGFVNLYEGLRRFMGQSVRLQWDTIDIDYDIPPRNFNRWFKNDRNVPMDYMVNSDYNIFQEYVINNGREPPLITITVIDRDIEPVQRRQRFSEGVTHCVFQCIKEFGEEHLENSKSKRTTERYRSFVKKVNNFIKEYKDGLPEDKVGLICEKLQIGIDITLPLCDIKFISERSFKKPLTTFKFMNTRIDHVNQISRLDDVQHVKDRHELIAIKKTLDKEKKFYIFTKNKGISSITTINKKYIIRNDYIEAVNDFETQSGLISCKIDDITQPVISSFVRAGVHYNLIRDFNLDRSKLSYDERSYDDKPLYHFDMSKAYFNYMACKYYNGFLGKITEFRKTQKIIEVGLYRIINIDFNGCNEHFRKILLNLNCYVSGNVYPSPALIFLRDNNVTFDIVEGCWGVKKLDIRFPETFKKEDSDGVKFYAKYVGTCNSNRLKSHYYMKGKREMFENIAYYAHENLSYCNGTGKVSYDKEHNFHLSHFTAFITEYQRLSTIEQLLEIDYDNIIRVHTDGIYTLQKDFKLCNVFREKTDFYLHQEEESSYVNNISYDYAITGADQKDGHRVELHQGAGGTGKTHKALTDKGYINILYVAPSWKLARNKQDEYNINSSVLARLISKDPNSYKNFYKYYSVIVFDEVSQYSKEDVDTLIKRFDLHKLIFCGDIGYQLPCIHGTPLTTGYFDNIIEHKKNYRIKDNRLMKLCAYMRSKIDEGVRSFVLTVLVKKFFKDNLKKNIVKRDEMDYNIDDMILCSTNKLKDLYTKMFKDTFEQEKYYIVNNCTRGYYNGTIVIKPKGWKEAKANIRHAFTIHSIQGETAKNKVFIDLKMMTKPELIYTAISRARTLDQIYLIE